MGEGAYLTEAGGKATQPIPRAQPYSGLEMGMHFPLHIGTEVVLSHVEGDPNRPIIVGALPNERAQSPVTGAEGTMNRIRTRSGATIEIDDVKG